MIEAKTEKHPLDHACESANRTRSILGHPRISKKEIFRIFNSGRNVVKHYTPGESPRSHHDKFGEAFMMIQRATSSADYFKLTYKGKRQYRNWYIAHGFDNPWKK